MYPPGPTSIIKLVHLVKSIEKIMHTKKKKNYQTLVDVFLHFQDGPCIFSIQYDLIMP